MCVYVYVCMYVCMFEKHTSRGEGRVRPLPRLALLERTVGPMKTDLGQVHHPPALHGQPRPRGPHHGTACELQGMPTCPPGKVRRGRRMLHGHQEPHNRRRCALVDFEMHTPRDETCTYPPPRLALRGGASEHSRVIRTRTPILLLFKGNIFATVHRGIASALRGTDQSPSDGRVR